ncbi:MAG TPA: hypothetical protein VEZ90_14045, partial [Blastocatellia bacterium]|nr:hypothetical protein [Blastocatellia bacterium]
MHHRRVVVHCFGVLLLLLISPPHSHAQTPLPAHPQPQESLPDAPSFSRPLPEHPKSQASSGATSSAKRVDEGWPRKATRGDE